MRQLSPAGQQIISDIAQRHGFSQAAVLSMLDSVIAGNGSQAQFSHPEFGGSGQWMRGGMIMLSDMFDNHLKGRVDALCSELSGVVANQLDRMRSGSFQSQSQGGQQRANYSGGQQQQGGSGPAEPVSLFVPPEPGQSRNWWPNDLGWPSSTGAQNHVRYAYFAQPRRLAIDVNGKVTVHDTLDHQLGGFSQQQSYGASMTFSSQHGLIDVASLPVVSVDGAVLQPPPTPAPATTPPPAPYQQNLSGGQPSAGPETGIFAAIEKLADLRSRGILSEEEFATKKTELLSRL